MFKPISTGNIDRAIRRINDRLPTIAQGAHREFVKLTPVRSGNARRSTGFVNGDTIDARYNYANRLNTGWSRQAPGGMTDPVIDYIRRTVRQILGSRY